MLLIQEIGNDIHPSIQLEVDFPSNHGDGKMPILDLKVWRERKENKTIIMHEFNSKDVSSKAVINAKSAIPWSTKRTVLTQEMLRVLLNCSKELPWRVPTQHVNEMVLRMQYSGYSKKFRYEVVNSALKAYDERMSADENGTRPLYRPNGWKTRERAIEKQKKKNSWYKKGGNDSVIFVPATPRSELQKRYAKEIKAKGLNIKVFEQAGVSLKRLLQRSNPFKRKVCEKDDCMVCRTEGKGSCDAHGVTYSITCTECINDNDKERVYIGETSRSAYTRGKEHLTSLSRKEEGSALWKHSKEIHNGHMPGFRMSVTGQFRNDAMLRQISEAVKINREGKKNVMNDKCEWKYVHVPHVAVE